MNHVQKSAYINVSTYALSSIVGLFYTDTLSYPPVIAGQRYEASVYTGALRCTVDMYVTFLNAAGAAISNIVSTTQNSINSVGGTDLTQYTRLSVIGTAPTGAVTAQFVIRKSASNTKVVGTLVVATTYFILTIGTTTQAQWNTITGVVATHAVGDLFTCANAGVGMGAGTVYESSSYALVALPFFAAATTAQTNLSAWSEGMSGSTKQITSTNISTYIATAAITTAYIGDLQVDTLQIAGQAVTIPSAFSAAGFYMYAYSTVDTLGNTFTAYGYPAIITISVLRPSALSGYCVVNSGVVWASNIIYMEVLIDGISVVSPMVSLLTTTSISIRQTLSAGSHTITVRFTGECQTSSVNYAYISGVTATIMEVKR